jgi:hypothetical protein
MIGVSSSSRRELKSNAEGGRGWRRMRLWGKGGRRVVIMTMKEKEEEEEKRSSNAMRWRCKSSNGPESRRTDCNFVADEAAGQNYPSPREPL